ncbi:hypothetical protein SAMN05443572_11076 [Myxococcus fulvus]|uniref:Uncharacterized protein n=1 Tax=Myxococcus fulvus TaxID=33 RepID=A0A511TA24_MYXFU|nr:hypothetical protein [Myxococcus fulvus]GEN10322.1 hypothetical protein MFU01_53590 [Myxococcus fulvus]SEU34546.1 hypothetical protein SAMN05443572_11076 [Myxococcus fulvus]
MSVGPASSRSSSVGDKDAAARRAAEEARRAAEAARKAAEAARKAAEAARKAAEAAQRAASDARKTLSEKQKATVSARQKAEQPGLTPEAAKAAKAQLEMARNAERDAANQAVQADKALQTANEKVVSTAKQAQGALSEANAQAVREGKPAPFTQKDIDQLLPKATVSDSAFDGPQRGGGFDKLFGAAPTGPELTSLLTEDTKDGQANCLDVAADWVDKASPELRARSELVFLEDQRQGAEGQSGHVVVRQGEKVFDPTTNKSYASMGDYMKDQPHYKEVGGLTANKARAIFDTPPGSPARAAALAKAQVPDGLQKMMVADPSASEQAYGKLVATNDPATLQTLKELGIQNASDFAAYSQKLAQKGPADLGATTFDNVKDKKAARTIVYEALASNPKTKAALDHFKISKGEDLETFAKSVSTAAKDELKDGEKAPDLKGFADKEALTQLLRGAGAVSEDWDTNTILSTPSFTDAIAKGVEPKEAKPKLTGLGDFTAEEASNLTRSQEARKALRKLAEPMPDDPEKQAVAWAERAAAAFTLAEQAKNAVPPEKFQKFMLGASAQFKAYDKGTPLAKSTAELVSALADPDKNWAKITKASVSLVKDLGLAAGEFPGLNGKFKQMFGNAEGPLRSVSALFTLLDPKAKWHERVLAGTQLATELPGLVDDRKSLTKAGREAAQAILDAGGPNLEALLKAGTNLTQEALSALPEDLKNRLTPGQQTQIAQLADKVDPAELTKVLQSVSKPEALDSVLKQVEAAPDKDTANRFLRAASGLPPKLADEFLQDAASTEKLVKLSGELADPKDLTLLHNALNGVQTKEGLAALTTRLTSLGEGEDLKRLVNVLGSVKKDQLEAVLKDTGMLDNLSKMAKELTDPDDLGRMSRLIQNMDAESLGSFSKMVGSLKPEEMSTALKLMGPLLEKFDSRSIGKLFKLTDAAITKMGPKVTEHALTIIKHIGKMIPVAGAVPGVFDAVKLANESVELKGQNKDLSFLALTGSKLNAFDSVAGLLMDLTGVGAAVDLGVGIPLAITELALDIGLTNEKTKMKDAKSQGKPYEAPGWVKAANLAGAAAMGPLGAAELIAHYGVKDTIEMLKWGVEQGGELATKLKGLLKEASKDLPESLLEASRKWGR